MAVLTETNLTTTDVGNALGNISRNVGVLCTDTNINKWSKNKPVIFSNTARVTANNDLAVVQKATNGQHGFVLSSNWAYDKPTGGASEPFALGDFRGYEHVSSIVNKCMPPVFCLASDFDESDLSPASFSGDRSYHPVKTYRLGGIGENNEFGVIPSLITPDLDNYYIGIELSRLTPSAAIWYKTYVQVVNGNTVGSALTINTTLIETVLGNGIWVFQDFPAGAGTYKIRLYLMSSLIPNWSTTAPSAKYELPSGTFDGIVYKSNSKIFTVNNWIIFDPFEVRWVGTDEAVREVQVVVESGKKWRITPTTMPAWMVYEVGFYVVFSGETLWRPLSFDGSGYYDQEALIADAAPYDTLLDSKVYIRLDPSTASADRNSTIGFQVTGDVTVSGLYVDQSATASAPAFRFLDNVLIETVVDSVLTPTSGVAGDTSVTVKLKVTGWISGITPIRVAITHEGLSDALSITGDGEYSTPITLTNPLTNGSDYTVTIDNR